MKRAIYAIPATAAGLLLSGCPEGPAVCGDGVVGEGEACDDGNAANTDSCLSTCQNAACGDSFVQAGVEECDDANGIDNDACTNACTNAKCGDSIVFNQVGGDEECDDGNNSDTDACTTSCLNAACGDGFIQAPNGETCEDGNNIDNDGCNNACVLDEIVRNFEITTRANFPLTDGVYTPCGPYGCYTTCDQTFNAPLTVALGLGASGSYSRDRVCQDPTFNVSNSYNLTGSATIGTPGVQYNISLTGGAQAITLDCGMDASSNLTCTDQFNRSWVLTAQ